MGRPITPEEENKMREMLLAGMQTKEVAKALGRGTTVVTEFRRKNGITDRWTEAERAYVIENYDRMTAQDIAYRLGRTRSAVLSFVCRNKVPSSKFRAWKTNETKWLKANFHLGITRCALHLGRSRTAVAKKMLEIGV